MLIIDYANIFVKRVDKLKNKKAEVIFKQYYDEHLEYIRSYCYYKLYDYPDYAEDCIQDTFRVLFEKLQDDVEIKYVKAFLMKTASNFIKLKFRQIDKEKNKCVSIDEKGFDVEYNQEFFKIDEETIHKLKDEILNSLTDDERRLLEKTCRNYKDSYKSTKELAAEYGCSELYIRQKIFLLRSKIKAQIKEKTNNL